ncbi:hypothetical protein DIE18_02250 [Burkholderia sp. Bp9125]|nr:hypothetical protein DIE18_02250 [Burkholderia sp. Bp9125]
MLSCIETGLGLTVFGPDGVALRIQRTNPAFMESRRIVREASPEQQKWSRLQALMANPLIALVNWCAGFGMRLVDEGDTLRLQDRELGRAGWLPLLNRCQLVAGSPQPVALFAEMLGAEAAITAKVSNVCLHLRRDAARGMRVGVVQLQNLPAAARRGDRVEGVGTGDTPFLVSYDKVNVNTDGTLRMVEGTVLGPVPVKGVAMDVLEQPAILGFDRTYRCEEGAADGWLEDCSYDSLKEAIGNAREIQNFGSEARIINRITGEVVAWS